MNMKELSLCPVCKGKGMLFVLGIDDETGREEGNKVCHGCEGRGWVSPECTLNFNFKITDGED